MRRITTLGTAVVVLAFGAAFGLFLRGGPAAATLSAQTASATATSSASPLPTAHTETPTTSASPLPTAHTETPTTLCGPPLPVVTPGWNLVGGPTGAALRDAVLPLYRLQPPSTDYQPINGDVLTAPQGYWAYYTTVESVFQPCVSGAITTVALPASQYVMVGDPFNGSASISASAPSAFAITYNTYLNTWSSWTQIGSGQSMQLSVGQGAFVFSAASATLTITPS